MIENPFVIAAIFAMISFVAYLVMDASIRSGQNVKKIERDARLTKSYHEAGVDRDGGDSIQLEEDVSGLARGEEQFMRVIGINVDKAIKEAKRETLLAGMDSPNSHIHLIFYRKILSYIISMMGILLIIKFTLLSVSAGVLILLIGLFGAPLYVANNRQKRQKKLVRSFPDGLDLMVVCVESGLALDAAINRVSDELSSAHPELGKELNKTRLELALLNNRTQALMNLAERTDLVAYRSLVAALIQTERFGTNLTDTLRVLSDDYRQTRLMMAEEKAGRLPALMALPLITLLLPSFVLVVMGPAVIRIKAQGGIMGGK